MSLFEGTKNIHGDLPPEARQRILKFIDDPTPDNWQLASIVMVRPLTTLFQAVRSLDRTFPKEGRQVVGGKIIKDWARVPDAITVVRAIKHAVRMAKRASKTAERLVLDNKGKMHVVEKDIFGFENEVRELNDGKLMEFIRKDLAEELDIPVD